MTDAQLVFAVGVPLVVNTTISLMMYWALGSRLNDLRETVRAELRRVEEVLDARLKHLEEK